MANNPLAIFDPAQVPAHVKAAQEAGTSNIVTRAQVDTLTFPGKVWTMTVAGDKKQLTKVMPDGEEELVQQVPVVIIAYNENKGRSYYGNNTYDPNAEKAPLCWSNDGVTSDPHSSERQSEKCNVCPQAIKGSRQNDQGKATVACGSHRNIAVVPLMKDLANAPLLRMRIPQTSDFDGLNKEAMAEGKFAFQNYLNTLKAKGVPFTYSLSTRLRFDSSKNFPKIWFSPGRWLTDGEAAICAEIAASPTLGDLLKTDFASFGPTTPQRPAGITDEDEEETETVAATPSDDEDEPVVVTPPPPKAAAKPVVTKSTAAPKPATNGATAPAPAAATAKAKTDKKAQAAAATAAARKAAALADDDEDGDGEDEAPAMAAKATVIAPSKVPASGSSNLDTVLAEWDD